MSLGQEKDFKNKITTIKAVIDVQLIKLDALNNVKSMSDLPGAMNSIDGVIYKLDQLSSDLSDVISSSQ